MNHRAYCDSCQMRALGCVSCVPRLQDFAHCMGKSYRLRHFICALEGGIVLVWKAGQKPNLLSAEREEIR
jgi:hypothetical protein